MKKLMFALTMMLGTAVAVQAQETQDTTSTDQSSQYRTDDQSTQDQSTQDQSTQDQSTQDQSVTEDPTLQDQSRQDQSTQDQSTQPTQDQSYRTDDQDNQDKGEEISIAELPAAVSTQLQSSDYTGWTATKVHRKMKDGETVYAVEMSQGSETKKVKFDEQGNVLKEKDKNKKDRDQK